MPGAGTDAAAEIERARIVLADCCASYFPQFHEMGLAMIKAQGGIFGWVSSSGLLLNSLAATA